MLRSDALVASSKVLEGAANGNPTHLRRVRDTRIQGRVGQRGSWSVTTETRLQTRRDWFCSSNELWRQGDGRPGASRPGRRGDETEKDSAK
jgi:hypothetical protein